MMCRKLPSLNAREVVIAAREEVEIRRRRIVLTVELEVAVDGNLGRSTFKTSTRCRQIRMGVPYAPERFGREVWPPSSALMLVLQT